MKRVLLVVGTRPEWIKMKPIYALMKEEKKWSPHLCLSGQHKTLLDPFLNQLEEGVAFSFPPMSGDLYEQSASILQNIGKTLGQLQFDLVLVQGDTTTAFIASLAAFYAKVPVGHVEAGLRTGDIQSPWPEEAHRRLITPLASFFFAPCERAKEHLLREGVAEGKIWVVGNTCIDVLRNIVEMNVSVKHRQKVSVTVHRRESFGEPLREICKSLALLAQTYPQLGIEVLLHPNPSVRETIEGALSTYENIQLREPMEHADFIHLLMESLFVITDSGGVQEEAPYLGIPLVVVRDTTERMEGIEAGTARLVGTGASQIFSCCKELVNDAELRKKMSKRHFPYGTGDAASKIVKILEKELL